MVSARSLSSPTIEKIAAGGDEEREDRQHRHVSEVAGMDETVVVSADEDALDDFACPRSRPEFAGDALVQRAPPHGLLAPRLRRQVDHRRSRRVVIG